eukprot:353149-Chlamydomonas_euryale.AAC.15
MIEGGLAVESMHASQFKAALRRATGLHQKTRKGMAASNTPGSDNEGAHGSGQNLWARNEGRHTSVGMSKRIMHAALTRKATSSVATIAARNVTVA